MGTKNYLLYAHGGSKNHGCEAIVRSTVQLLKGNTFFLMSNQPTEDKQYGITSLCDIVDNKDTTAMYFSVPWWIAYFKLKFFGDFRSLDDYLYCKALSKINGVHVAFSIGGDNYCYDVSGIRRFMKYRESLTKNRTKTVLWGCSVESALIDKKMRKDLSRYDLIVARETITYEALRKINSNVILAPDPAFTLKKAPANYPAGLGQKPYIGINVSPLIQSLDQGENITLENYRNLVRHILERTDRDIALIPHVVWAKNDDRVPLGQLYEEFKSTGRVFMVEDQNCMQLKEIISGSEFFVGARTHATIAAYSTCVPTLVVGYSVKARGIARDLFGAEEGYVLPVQELKDSCDLVSAFESLYARKEEIRNHLSNMMPEYIAGIQAAKNAVERL